MQNLTLENISYSFDEELFSSISLGVNQKEKIAIVGESGCGKSTLLHIMASFLKPQNGTVTIFDKDLYSLCDKEIINYRRHLLSIIFQQHYLFKGFILEENFALSSLIAKEEIDSELIDRFGLSNKNLHNVSSLSGGEQQRASIVRSLIKKPKIIFADEPTGNLDEKNSSIVIESLFDYVSEKQSSIILVTHDKTIANKCDKVFELKDKKLVQIQ